jgi:PAS domain S-box-containing protein
MQLDRTTLERILDALPLPLVAKDAGGIVRLMNRRARQLYVPFGAAEGVRVPDLLLQLGETEASAAIQKADREAWDSGSSQVILKLRSRQEGNGGPEEESFWRSNRFVVRGTEWGDLIVSLAEDVTGPLRTEGALRGSEELFRLVWEQSYDAMRLIDEHGTIVAVNAAFCRQVGRPREEIEGQPLWSLYEEIPEEQRQAFLASLAAGSQPPLEEHYFVRPDGRTIWNEVSYAPIQIARRGRLILSVFRDITERKRYQEELLAAKEAAESADRVKNEFLTNVSHEIRTPMQAILGLCDTMLETDLSPGQRELLASTRESAEALHRMLDELLDFSRFEAGGMTLDPAPFDPREILEKLQRAFAPRASSRGLRLELRTDSDLPGLLVGDAFRLRQVLMNLVGNAIKFTENGSVRLEVAVLARTPERVRLRFQVIDTGVGIPPGKQSEIFRPFVQADGSTARRHGGAGLGLSISMRLVELMGGHLVCASDGAGSTFSFAVDFPVAAAAARRPLRVLAVEDNPVNRELLVRSLRQLGHTVVAAEDGRQALAALERERFDIVFMDIQMPEIDGIAVTRAIREREARERAARPLPVIAITANGTAEDRRRCREAGMNGYLDKPLNRNELARAVAGFAAPGIPPVAGAALDRESALQRVGGDESLLRDIGQLFLEEYPALLEAIRAAAAARDAHRLERSAHSLKGSVANFGAAGAVAAALRLEKLGRAQSFEDVDDALAELEAQLAQLRPEIVALVTAPDPEP